VEGISIPWAIPENVKRFPEGPQPRADLEGPLRTVYYFHGKCTQVAEATVQKD